MSTLQECFTAPANRGGKLFGAKSKVLSIFTGGMDIEGKGKGPLGIRRGNGVSRQRSIQEKRTRFDIYVED